MSFDEVIRVAVLAAPDAAVLPPAQAALLRVIAERPIPGCHVELLGERPSDGTAPRIGPHHDLVHVLGGRGPLGSRHAPLLGSLALAAEHGLGLIAHYPAAPALVAPARCRVILSPSAAADAELLAAGARPGQLRRWCPGVDPEAFGPGHYSVDTFGGAAGRLHVVCPDRPTDPELLDAALAAAAARDSRLVRVSAPAADGAERSRVFASADLLVCDDTGADVPLEIIEAQASGLPVLALDGGGARASIEDGRDGVLVPATTAAIAEALVVLARRAALRERLTVGGLAASRERRWDTGLRELALAWAAGLRAGTGLIRTA